MAPPPYSYSLNGGAQAQAAIQFVSQSHRNTTYTITATDAAQASAVTEDRDGHRLGGGGGSGGGGPISCPGYSSTQTVNLGVVDRRKRKTIPAGESDAIVITFTPLGEIGASGVQYHSLRIR